MRNISTVQNIQTETERIRAIIEGNAPLRIAEIVTEEVGCFRRSEAYKNMLEANSYYRNRSDVQRKRNDFKNRSNSKIEHPILKKLVDQKVNFLLSRDWTVSSENADYARELNLIFGDGFRRNLKLLGKNAIVNGIGYMMPFFDEGGRFDIAVLPSMCVVPIWADDAHIKLDSFINFYEKTVYLSARKTTVTYAEYWYQGGMKLFCADNGIHFSEVKNAGSESHFLMNSTPFVWENVPLVWAKYNDEELPLCYYIKELIDDINWQTSVTADTLRDAAKFVYILRNYGGADIDEFVRDLREALAVKVDENGGVEKLQADINIDAVLKFLDKQRHDVYDYAMGVDTKDANLGSASGVAINFRYMDLENDCVAFSLELKALFAQLKPFVDAYLQLSGRGDFSGESFDVTFNLDLPVNEADIIANIKASEGILSRQTLLKNHPWVRDVDFELGEVGGY